MDDVLEANHGAILQQRSSARGYIKMDVELILKKGPRAKVMWHKQRAQKGVKSANV